MSTELDLEEVLEAIKEITNSKLLARLLGVDSSIIEEFVVESGGYIYKQKDKLIDYWLQTSPDASWTTLAKAVERMGRHDDLAKKLRRRAEQKKI